MNRHGLNGLREVVPMMLHAIRIIVEEVQGEYIVVCWNGHEVVGNSRLYEQTSIVSAIDHDYGLLPARSLAAVAQSSTTVK